MRKVIFILTVFSITMLGKTLFAQEYSFNDFIGTWHGTISSESFTPYNDPMTMIIEEDGFYTETSGHLMPTIYPNTQLCDYDEETNRMHWSYLYVVYAGQYHYQHFYYDVVNFSNDTLEMHYNFWDDPIPHPQVGTIFLVKETTVGLNNLQSNDENREIIKVYDLMGREKSQNTRGELLIFIYSDGSSEKRFIK